MDKLPSCFLRAWGVQLEVYIRGFRFMSSDKPLTLYASQQTFVLATFYFKRHFGGYLSLSRRRLWSTLVEVNNVMALGYQHLDSNL